MANCTYKYKGKDYTKDEFYSLVRTTMVQPRTVQIDKNSNQFQKLTSEEKAKTIEQVTKEHRSIAALKDLSAKLAYRIGGEVKFENNPNADWKGYNQGMKSVLNEAYMTPDTPFHEILAHPIIRAIKTRSEIDNSVLLGNVENFTSLYDSLLKELETGRGKDLKQVEVKKYLNRLRGIM